MLIAVVEDNEFIRSAAVGILDHAGYAALSFESADSAVTSLGSLRSTVSLVLTDVSMPGALDGLDFARLMSHQAPHLPVIVMSLDADSLVEARGIPTVVGVLAKPFAPNELVALVTRLAHPLLNQTTTRRQP